MFKPNWQIVDYDGAVVSDTIVERKVYKWIIKNFQLRIDCYKEAAIVSPLLGKGDDLVWKMILEIPSSRPVASDPSGLFGSTQASPGPASRPVASDPSGLFGSTQASPGPASRPVASDPSGLFGSTHASPGPASSFFYSPATSTPPKNASNNAAKVEPKSYFGLKAIMVEKKETMTDKFRVTLSVMKQGARMHPHVTEEFTSKGQSQGPSSFVDAIKIKDFLEDDALTIRLDVEILKFSLPGEDNQSYDVKIAPCQLSNNLAKLFDSAKHHDVIVKCHDKSFHCVKGILASRSEVFEAMFTHDTKEAQQNVVDVNNVSSGVMKELLRFIYTGQAPDFKDSQVCAIDILVGADKYALHRLRSLCEAEVLKSLSLENFCHVLMVADRHSALQVKRFAMDFFRKNEEKVLETSIWKELEKNNPKLAIETLKSKREVTKIGYLGVGPIFKTRENESGKC